MQIPRCSVLSTLAHLVREILDERPAPAAPVAPTEWHELIPMMALRDE